MGYYSNNEDNIPALEASSFDACEFEELWNDPDIPEDQKRKLLGILWRITLDFVDMGFGIHPVQLRLNPSEFSDECKPQSQKENQSEKEYV